MSDVYTPRIPSYRRHKPTGQAVVTLNGKDVYLGKWNTRESRRNYDRLIGEWMAGGRCLPPEQAGDLTVFELAAAYKRFAKEYHLRDGKGRQTYGHIRKAMQLLGETYGPTPAKNFGPLAFKALRERMIRPERSRHYTNTLADMIRRAFKWAVEQELVPPSVFHGLQAVPGLKRGRCPCKEGEKVQAVDDATIEATLPYLSPIVADMVRLQRLTGARPAEVCILRPCDVDVSRDVWEYRPSSHKTEHHGRERVIFVGPKAQDVLRPYLLRDNSAFCFLPAESEAKRNAERRANRRSPMTPSQAARRRKRKPLRIAGDRYETDSYRRAIHRAADVADNTAKREAREAGQHVDDGARLVDRWSPNQLRHTAATEIRKRFGLEAAGTVLGHSRADVTQIYAERDLGLAAKVAREVG